MYSPPVGGAARRPIATIDKEQTSNRRFIIFSEEDYLCGARNSQVVGRDSPTRPIFADVEPTRPRVVTSKQTARGAGRLQAVFYQPGSTSSRTRSSQVCRFRISASLSPRTSTSAGSGREL